MVYQQGNNQEVAELLYTLLGPLLTLRSLGDQFFDISEDSDSERDETGDITIYSKQETGPVSQIFEVPENSGTIDNEGLVVSQTLDRLLDLLVEMALSPLQFDEIRKLTCELCSRFPCSAGFKKILKNFKTSILTLPISEILAHVSEIGEDKKEAELVVAKTFILFFCGSLVKHGEKIQQFLASFAPFLVDVLLWPELGSEVPPGKRKTVRNVYSEKPRRKDKEDS
jgi:hypothetical protein